MLGEVISLVFYFTYQTAESNCFGEYEYNVMVLIKFLNLLKGNKNQNRNYSPELLSCYLSCVTSPSAHLAIVGIFGASGNIRFYISIIILKQLKLSSRFIFKRWKSRFISRIKLKNGVTGCLSLQLKHGLVTLMTLITWTVGCEQEHMAPG